MSREASYLVEGVEVVVHFGWSSVQTKKCVVGKKSISVVVHDATWRPWWRHATFFRPLMSGMSSSAAVGMEEV